MKDKLTRCKYCGARLRRNSVGLYCPTKNCQWSQGVVEEGEQFELFPGINRVEFKSFYNTIHEEGEQRIESEIKAQDQEALIKRLYLMFPATILAPHQVHKMLFSVNVPLTSVRRAMTNLTKEGFLVKLGKDQMILGPMGKMVHRWALNESWRENQMGGSATGS